MGRLPSQHTPSDTVSLGVGEPTRGDTVHVDVADRFGNLFSATLGRLAAELAGESRRSAGRSARARRCSGSRKACRRRSCRGTRPRTTLSPGLVLRGGEPWLAYGTPGGDQQEQWALHVLLRHVDRGIDLHEAMDAADFHTERLIDSFYPARLQAGPAARGGARSARRPCRLSARAGRDVVVAPPWSLGRVCRGQARGRAARAPPRIRAACRATRSRDRRKPTASGGCAPRAGGA